MTDTLCEGCGEHSFLLPLHGGKGGPLRCPLCVGAWNAEHGRKRRTGRIVIRAIKAFLDAGGSNEDIKKLTDCASFGDLDIFSEHNDFTDPLGYMDGIARLDGADTDLTSELLADVLKLTHPDHHPPERKLLAHQVTQKLLALQPFVFPAPKQPPEPEQTEPEPATSVHSAPESKPSPPRYPCADCADTVPYFYCDACRAEHEKRTHEEGEHARAKQREWYARRPKMWTPPKPPKGTPKPRTPRQSLVAVNQIRGSNLINQGLSGLQAAILIAALTKRVPGARGCDVSYPELLAEIWGWEPRYELRFTEEDVEPYRGEPEQLYRVGDPRPSDRTFGAFKHILPHKRRAARASLSRALTRLEQRMLISFVDGTGCYSGGPVLTPHGEQIARSLTATKPDAKLGTDAA
jgi:hypothetical protein